jgi:hypothetical protein
MLRPEIRNYIRILADELTEAPEGLFMNAELDLLINVSQQNIAIALAPYIPWAVTKSFLISTTSGKREYDIATDLSVTDFFMMQGIFHNESGYKQSELRFVDRDQLVEYYVIGASGDPRVWSWESMGVIAFDPCPGSSVSNKYKAAYIPIFKELNSDTHDPATSKYAIPFNGSSILTPTHELLAMDVLKQWLLRSGGDGGELDSRYERTLEGILFTMSQAQGITHRGRPNITEIMKE